jgi:FkbM family methyltransferase
MFKLKLPNGFKMLIPSLQDLKIIEEIWFSKCYDYFSIKPGWTIVDIGAHIGAFSIKIAKEVGNLGRIIAIEPHPYNFEIMNQNLLINNIQNVMVFKYALSEKCGHVKLYIGETSYGHSITPERNLLVQDPHAYSKSMDVPTITLSNLFKDLHLGNLDLVKIDVEGAELLVLKGGEEVLSQVRRLIIDVDHYPQEGEEICDFLQEALSAK